MSDNVNMKFEIDTTQILRWSKGSCGNSGCTDETCVCAVCALPIGIPEDDPLWQDHPDYCGGCPICEDEVPTTIFSGKGEAMVQATFHEACFRRILKPVLGSST